MCTPTAAPRLDTRKAVIVDTAFWSSGMNVAEQCVCSCMWNESKGIQLFLLNIIIFIQYGLKPLLLGARRHITHTQCVHDVQVGYLWVCVWVCEWGGIEGDCLSPASNRSTVLKLPQSEEIAAFSWQGDWRDRPAGQTNDKTNMWTLLFHMDRRVVLTGTFNQSVAFLFFVFLSVMTKNALSGQDFCFFVFSWLVVCWLVQWLRYLQTVQQLSPRRV